MGKKRRLTTIATALLALFWTYQASITLFAHVHIVNGVMIVHSHPSSSKDHIHTAGQVITIAQLASFQTLEAAEAPCTVPDCPVLYVLAPCNHPSRTQLSLAGGILLRAPPCPSSFILRS